MHPLIVPMRSRSPAEAHRVSTPLELLFDLVFVIAVAQAASHLHHGIADGHVAEAVVSYGMVFFAIWWAWMNFTWFASAYDTDDVLYRLAVFAQLTGALILAAGVPQAFDGRNYAIVTVGYLVMRTVLVAQWLRAVRTDVAHRITGYRYVFGLSALQAGWIALLFVPVALRGWGFVVLVALELAVPIWAERTGATPWHPEHIAERFGLFTIIVLGESILSASGAIQSALEDGALNLDLIEIGGGGLLLVLAMWWLYFDRPEPHPSTRTAFVWGYGHLFIFAAAAAVGAGLAVAVDYATHHAALGAFGANAAVAMPVAIFLVGLWALQPTPRARHTYLLPLAALLTLLTCFSGQAVLLTGVLLAALLAVKIAARYESRG